MAMIKDASLTARLAREDEPVIDIDGINLTIRVEQEGEGRVLTLDPVVIFDRRKLSPKLTTRLLQLIDPTLTDSPQIGGEIFPDNPVHADWCRCRDKAVKGMELKANSCSIRCPGK